MKRISSLILVAFLVIATNAKAQFTISASGPTDICSGIVTLVVDNPQPNFTYNWFFGAYACAGSTGSMVPYGNPGTMLQVFGTGEFFCIGSDQNGMVMYSNPIPVRINAGSIGSMYLPAPYPQSVVNCLASVPLCVPSIFYETFPNTSIKWYKNNVIINGATSPSYTATTSGYYKYSYTAGACVINYSDSVLVNTPPATPAITASQPSPACVGQIVNFTISNPVNGVVYQWEVSQQGGAYMVAGTGTSFNYTIPPTSYILVRAKITAPACNQYSNVLTLQIQNLNLLISPGNNVSVCSGTVTNFIATSAVPNPVYQWYLNGNSISGATQSSYSSSLPGTYYVTLSYTCGIVYSNQVTITVNALPAASITASGPTTFCSGGNVTLDANTGAGLTYQWKKYGNNVVGATNPSLNVTSTGKYKVVVTNASGCTKNSNTIEVTVNPLPTASITAIGSTSFCAGDSVVLSANTGAGLTYQWKKYSNNVVGATSQNYSAKTTGKYKCVVTNANGCSRSSNSINVSVVCREGLFNLEEISSTAIVFPNPSDGDFQVIIPQNDNHVPSLKVFDVSGKVLQNISITKNEQKYIISGVPSGVYFLEIKSLKTSEIIKLVKTQ